MSDRGLMLTTRAIDRQLSAMPHDVYLVQLIHSTMRRALPGKRLWTAAELRNPATIRFLRGRNRDGYDIYIRPDGWDQNAGYVLVDLDRVAGNVIDHMRINGHDPCLVVQTSPGHLQAWIQVSRSGLESFVATAVARQLARQYGGDLGAADGRHLGRLAGFTNQKPNRRGNDGYAPWVRIVHARAGLASHADALIRSAIQERPPSFIDTADTSWADNPIAAATAQGIYADSVARWRIVERFRPPDWSIVDLWVARSLLSQGRSAAQVEAILKLGSPRFPRRHGNPEQYLRRTVRRAAFSPLRGPV